ncbi:MAG: Crp/Fnr family transcriptional regulator [Alphaproteobacteria bacterium]|nr:Crp/Fnr family transcriptional regulator [Alphaproteobacteria bacterium]
MLRSYASGETICHHGDPYNGVYALVSGQLKIELPTSDGDYKILSMKQPVFWFGQGASLEKGRFYATITASSPASVLFLPHHEFERLIQNAAYCRAIAILTLEHFSEASQVLGQLLAADVEHRVGARLALLAERAGGKPPVVLPITQSELAEMCNFGRHTVQQILGNLEKRGLIRTGYRRVAILNPDALTLGSGMNVVSAARDPDES